MRALLAAFLLLFIKFHYLTLGKPEGGMVSREVGAQLGLHGACKTLRRERDDCLILTGEKLAVGLASMIP